MKLFWNILIVVLLLVLISLVLFNNKKEMDLQIAFAEREVEQIPVNVAIVKEGTINQELVFRDVIKPISELRVHAPVEGRILEIYQEEGDNIARNELLIKTDDYYIQAEFEIDRRNYELAQKNLSRVESLKEENALPKNQYEQLQANAESAEIKKAITEKRLNETRVKSPVSGHLNQLFVKEGMMINGSVPICEIVDLSRFKIVLFLGEDDVRDLKVDMEAVIALDTQPNNKFTGKITHVSLNADFALKYKVVVEFDNTSEWLKGGMFCSVFIPIPDDDPGIIVPWEAMINEEGRNFVYLIKDGCARKRDVTIINEGKEDIKVTGDLMVGDTIVVAGQTRLQADSKVAIVKPNN